MKKGPKSKAKIGEITPVPKMKFEYPKSAFGMDPNFMAEVRQREEATIQGFKEGIKRIR